MSVVDYLLNSLIKRLQKIQKARKKIKTKKRHAAKASRKTRKTKSPKRSLLTGKRKKIKKKKRIPGRPAKRIYQKSSKEKKKKVPSRKSPVRRKAKSKKAKKTKRIIKQAPKIKDVLNEICIGEVTHFFSRIQVIVLKMNKGKLLVGDQIHIAGRTTDFIQKVKSLQIESVDVKSAKKGQLVGLKVAKKAKPGDQVFKRAN